MKKKLELLNNQAKYQEFSLKFDSDNLQYDENTQQIRASNTSIKHHDNIINAEKMVISDKLQNIQLKKVKANLLY